MAVRPIIKPTYVVANGDMSGNITSLVTNIEQISLLSYDVVWTGTPTGTFQVQVSNSYVPAAFPSNIPVNPGNWTVIPSADFQGSYPVPSGSASNGALDIGITGFTWIRLVYVSTSGSGSLNVVVSGKVS